MQKTKAVKGKMKELNQELLGLHTYISLVKTCCQLLEPVTMSAELGEG